MGFLKRSNFTPHPEGLTVGQLADIEMDEHGKFGPQIKFMFDTDEQMDDGRPFRLTHWCTPVLNEKSNLYKLLKAFGEDPDSAAWDDLQDVGDLDDLIGRKIQIVVTHKKDGDRINARVDSVMPLRKPRQRPAAAEAPVETREPAAAGGGNGRATRKPDFTDEED